jgi:TatD DNase family protein
MIFTDTHTHLYSKDFDEDRTQQIDEAIAAGVKTFYLPNIDVESIEPMLAVEKQYPDNCLSMMGLHPCSVDEKYEEQLAVMEEWINKRPFIAIGEIGIDLYWEKAFLKQQQIAFKKQIEWAKKLNIPYDIHCRDAFNEVMEVVSEFKNDNIKAIFHCFGGTIEQAQQVLDAGDFKLGIGGVVTFKNAGLDKVVANIDLKDIVIETDAPYLAPAPKRGKRNNPDNVILVAQKIAEIKKISIEEVARVTTENANYIFNR